MPRLQEMDKTEDTPLIEDYIRNVELSSFTLGELSPSSSSRTSGAKSHILYTVDDALDIIGVGTAQLAILCCMYIGMLAVYAQVLLKTTISDVFDCDMKLTTSQSAFVSTIFFIGEIASTYPVGRLIDKFGRRMGIIILSANLLYYGLILSVVPRNYPWVLFLRFLAGFFACGLQSTVVCYTGELAPTKYRTAFMMGLLLSAGLGAFYISTVGLFVVPSSLGWRWQAAFASLPSALILIAVLFIPESPRYCALHGDLMKAMQILKHLAERRRKKLPVGELVQIKENKTGANFLHLLLPQTRRQTLSLWLVGFSAYFCYYGVALATDHIIKYYWEDIDDGNGTLPYDDVIKTGHDVDVCTLGQWYCKPSTSNRAYQQTVITSMGDLLASPVALVMVVLLGRRRGMIISLLLATVALVCLTFSFTRIDPTGFILSTRGLTLGTYGILFLYAVEAYPTYTRAVAVTTCQFFAKGAGALTPFVADSYLVENPMKGLIIYSSICFVGAISGILLPFETAGRQLE